MKEMLFKLMLDHFKRHKLILREKCSHLKFLHGKIREGENSQETDLGDKQAELLAPK